MKSRSVAIAIVLGTIAVNGVALYVVKGRKSGPTSPALQPLPVPVPPIGPANDDTETVKREMGRARRAAGVASLEAGDYDRALIHFTEAQTLLGKDANVGELLRITEDLRTRAATRENEPAVPNADAPPLRQPIVQPTPTRREPVRREQRPVETPRPTRVASVTPPEPRVVAPEVPTTGLVLVTTTPRGLLVRIDDRPADLTPTRISAKVGSHQIAIYDGERKLTETTIEVEPGEAVTVFKDLTAEMAPRPAPTPSPVRETPPPVVRETPQPIAVVKPTAPPVTAPVSSLGGLEVSSPGLYAEVFINDKAYGFPPVSARGLPAGPTRVEVRVNGEVKRTTTVQVMAGRVLSVKVR